MGKYRTPLDSFDKLPDEMIDYLSHNGFHFNKKACEWAVSKMERLNPATGKEEKIEPWSKNDVENLLTTHGIKVENNIGYDFVYVANMCLADYYKKSIKTEADVAQYVKDTIDDVDACDGAVFVSWYAKMCHAGYPIPWEELL